MVININSVIASSGEKELPSIDGLKELVGRRCLDNDKKRIYKLTQDIMSILILDGTNK